MRRNVAKLLAALAVASPAFLAVSGGLASASGPSAGGKVHLYYADTAIDASFATVVLTGAITDSGTDCQGCAGNGLNVFVLSKGTFEINVRQLETKLPGMVNPATCSSGGSATAPVPIVANPIWDTGAYTGIRGTFNASASIAIIYPRGPRGQCDLHATRVPGVLIAHGPGTVSYQVDLPAR
jgi:hypothetical protein